MTNRRTVGLERMARGIKSSVYENGEEKGTMYYRTEPSRVGDGTDIIFTYAFFDREAKETVSIDKHDPEFEGYINNPGVTGRALLAYQLEDLRILFSETKKGIVNMIISEPAKTECKARGPRTENISRREVEKMREIMDKSKFQ